MNKCCVILFISLFSFVTTLAFPRDVRTVRSGDACTGRGGSGKCIPLQECPPGVAEVRAKRRHSLTRCGFSGIMEIVCCPLNSIDNEDDVIFEKESTTTGTASVTTAPKSPIIPIVGNRSQAECSSYSNEIPIPIGFNILGGTDASIGEYAHMAAIAYEGDPDIRFDCGGSLISKRYVLTAAHCIVRLDNKLPLFARFGIIDKRTGGVAPGETPEEGVGIDYPVESSTSHPDYRRPQHYHDVALLRLTMDVTYSVSVNPACLFTSPDPPASNLVATGWGQTTNRIGEASDILQKVSLDMVELSSCNESYTRQNMSRRLASGISPGMLCATGGRDRDACQGDSGGPLQVQIPESPTWHIVGITSFGVGCGGSLPGVYARVSYYLDWIEPIVWT